MSVKMTLKYPESGNNNVGDPGPTTGKIISQVVLKPTPTKAGNNRSSSKKNDEVFEASQKLEEMRERKFQQESEKWQKWQEEREAEQEMKEVEREKREQERERRKREHEQVEQQLKLFEEQRKAKQEEEARRQREKAEELEKKGGDGTHQGSFKVTSLINVVSLAAANSTKGQVKSRKEVIAEKAPPLNISEDTTTEELIEVVRMLREKLETVHGEIFDMTKKTQKQDYHINELDQRVRDMNQKSVKARPVFTIGSGSFDHLRKTSKPFQHRKSNERQGSGISAKGCHLYTKGERNHPQGGCRGR